MLNKELTIDAYNVKKPNSGWNRLRD